MDVVLQPQTLFLEQLPAVVAELSTTFDRTVLPRRIRFAVHILARFRCQGKTEFARQFDFGASVLHERTTLQKVKQTFVQH